MQQDTAIKIATKFVKKAFTHDKNIIKAYLFGSYARNEQHQWSDIDVCIVHKDLSSNYQNISKLIWNIKDDKREVMIEPVLIDRKHFNDGVPLPYIIKREGIPLPLI